MKITDTSSASGPAGGLLTCWDKDVLAFCHWKIRAHWQGRKSLGGVCWDRENHQCTAQHSFQPGQKKLRSGAPSGDWSSAWLQSNPVLEWRQCESFKNDKWHPRWEPQTGKPQHRGSWLGRKKENSHSLVIIHNCPIFPKGFHLAGWISAAVFNKQGRKAGMSPFPALACQVFVSLGLRLGGPRLCLGLGNTEETSRGKSGWFVSHFVS